MKGVVEPDHRNLVRHPASALAQGLQRTGSNIVAAGEYRGELAPFLEQRSRSAIAELFAKPPIDDMNTAHAKTVLREARGDALEPRDGVAEIDLAGQMHDLAMAQLEQMQYRLARAIKIVEHHGPARYRTVVATNRHYRYLGLAHDFDGIWPHRAFEKEDETVARPVDELDHGTGLFVWSA